MEQIALAEKEKASFLDRVEACAFFANSSRTSLLLFHFRVEEKEHRQVDDEHWKCPGKLCLSAGDRVLPVCLVAVRPIGGTSRVVPVRLCEPEGSHPHADDGVCTPGTKTQSDKTHNTVKRLADIETHYSSFWKTLLLNP